MNEIGEALDKRQLFDVAAEYVFLVGGERAQERAFAGQVEEAWRLDAEDFRRWVAGRAAAVSFAVSLTGLTNDDELSEKAA